MGEVSTVRTSNRWIILVSWATVIVCVVMWPITSLTIFRGEPQGVLGLSWMALILSAANTLITAYTKRSADISADSS